MRKWECELCGCRANRQRKRESQGGPEGVEKIRNGDA